MLSAAISSLPWHVSCACSTLLSDLHLIHVRCWCVSGLQILRETFATLYSTTLYTWSWNRLPLTSFTTGVQLRFVTTNLWAFEIWTIYLPPLRDIRQYPALGTRGAECSAVTYCEGQIRDADLWRREEVGRLLSNKVVSELAGGALIHPIKPTWLLLAWRLLRKLVVPTYRIDW